MSVRKAAGRRRSTDSGVGPERGAVCREKKEQRFALFLRDFDQQAKEHIQEMKEELGSLLQTAEKAFAVELLKMPVAIRNMRTKDFLSLEGGEEVALAAVVADCSLEDIPNPKLVRTNSRKVKVTTIVQYEDAKQTSAKKMSKKCLNPAAQVYSRYRLTMTLQYRARREQRKIMCRVTGINYKGLEVGRVYIREVSKTKSLVSLASGFGGKLTPLSRSGHSSAAVTDTMKPLASDCGATNFKTVPKVSKSAGLHRSACRTEPSGGRAHGMVLRSKSVPQDKTVPFVNIPLADGQTLCTAGGDLHNIDVQLLRQDTIQRIHSLVSELTVLYGKATAKMT